MAEWLKAPDSKSGLGAILTGVRIPPLPWTQQGELETLTLMLTPFFCSLFFVLSDPQLPGSPYTLSDSDSTHLKAPILRVDGLKINPRLRGIALARDEGLTPSRAPSMAVTWKTGYGSGKV